MDVLAVEGRRERALKAREHLAVDLVAPLLERLDLGDPLVEPVVRDNEVLELAGGGEQVLAVFDDQAEELLVVGDQADHRWPPASGEQQGTGGEGSALM